MTKELIFELKSVTGIQVTEQNQPLITIALANGIVTKELINELKSAPHIRETEQNQPLTTIALANGIGNVEAIHKPLILALCNIFSICYIGYKAGMCALAIALLKI